MSNLPLTTRARGVVEAAEAAAARLGHDYIGTGHLLLGLVADDKFLSAQILGQLGVTADSVNAVALQAMNANPDAEPPTAG